MDNIIDLKFHIIKLVERLEKADIIKYDSLTSLEDKNFYDIVLLLRDKLKEIYPNTKLKPRMKSIHYANFFTDLSLKESAFLLDEIEQYLSINKFLDHDEAVDYFNRQITADNFIINPTSLVLVMIESLYNKY